MTTMSRAEALGGTGFIMVREGWGLCVVVPEKNHLSAAPICYGC